MVTETIRRPIEVVADYTSDPSHAPEWYANISEVEWKTPPPVRVGSEVAFVAQFLGRELRYTQGLGKVAVHDVSSASGRCRSAA